MKLQNVTLELSSKPFIDDSKETMYRVCRKMFTQWKNLTDQAEKISVMLSNPTDRELGVDGKKLAPFSNLYLTV